MPRIMIDERPEYAEQYTQKKYIWIYAPMSILCKMFCVSCLHCIFISVCTTHDGKKIWVWTSVCVFFGWKGIVTFLGIFGYCSVTFQFTFFFSMDCISFSNIWIAGRTEKKCVRCFDSLTLPIGQYQYRYRVWFLFCYKIHLITVSTSLVVFEKGYYIVAK